MPLAVVTGATSPIGQAIALSFAERGFELLLHAHTGSQVLGHEMLRFDLASASGQDAFCDAVESRAQSIDVLVHNAASYEESTFGSLDREQWQKTIGLNAEAPVFITMRLLPLLKAAASPCVVNVTDAMYQRMRPKHFAYAMSKVMLSHATKALAVELAPHIRVNAVAPGLVDHSPDADKKRLIEKIPLRRTAKPQQIASAVTYLACEATYATGEILVIDGGRSLV